jgi:hypothetical protein
MTESTRKVVAVLASCWVLGTALSFLIISAIDNAQTVQLGLLAAAVLITAPPTAVWRSVTEWWQLSRRRQDLSGCGTDSCDI